MEGLIAQMEQGLISLDAQASGETDPVRAHATVEALEALRRSVTMAIETWRARGVELVGTVAPSDDERTVLRVVKPPKIRWDHDRIQTVVKRRAMFGPDGEILEGSDIADRACYLMRQLYISPSDEPKKTGLALIGVEEPMSMTLSVEEGKARVKEKVKR